MLQFLKGILLVAASLFAGKAFSQNYEVRIKAWQQEYKREFLTDARSPLRAKDTGFLNFFPADSNYCVMAEIRFTPESKVFEMATHSGKNKKFKTFGILTIKIPFQDKNNPASKERKEIRIPIYENLAHANDSFADYLFLPFTDYTSGEESYGGGRYIDLKKKDIQGNHVLVDFNKAYNPWCVYKGGYSCPIPPSENRIDAGIFAGEQLPAERIRAKE